MSIRSSNKIKIEGGMSSMTDLVFLLLIFFIILSALAKNNNTLDVNLPQKLNYWHNYRYFGKFYYKKYP